MGRMLFTLGACLAALLFVGCATSPSPRADTADTPRLEAEAAQGGAEQAYQLARHYSAHGDPRATTWYRRATRHRPVDRWVALSEFELGRIAATGQIDPRDRESPGTGKPPKPRTAQRWMHRSAEHGYTLAMLRLAVDAERAASPMVEARWKLRYAMTDGDLFLLAHTRDTLRDSDDGATLASLLQHTRTKAARGDPEALVDMGMLLHLGLGVEQDHAQALQSFERAGQAGNVFGMHFAGLLIVRGYLADKSRENAVPWFDAAYRRGFYPALEGPGMTFKFPELGG